MKRSPPWFGGRPRLSPPWFGSVEESRPACLAAAYDLEMKLIGPDGGDGLRAYLRELGST